MVREKQEIEVGGVQQAVGSHLNAIGSCKAKCRQKSSHNQVALQADGVKGSALELRPKSGKKKENSFSDSQNLSSGLTKDRPRPSALNPNTAQQKCPLT